MNVNPVLTNDNKQDIGKDKQTNNKHDTEAPVAALQSFPVDSWV